MSEGIEVSTIGNIFLQVKFKYKKVFLPQRKSCSGLAKIRARFTDSSIEVPFSPISHVCQHCTTEDE